MRVAAATWQAVEEAFLEAVEVEPAARGAFLDRRCAGDTSLRSQVEQLLAGHGGAEPEFITPPEPRHPTRIGRYVVTRLLATGGMGAVYEAEQDSPRRTVALKILRAALASPTLARRFVQESEVLARLRHPGIAQVYEAGVFDDGSGPVPFFAMELIEGAHPLCESLRARPQNEVLEVFARVCDAVHHGHQRGVIHRDLKPGNILIDRAGDPKVIDFGIARAADSSADSMHTTAGQLIGTIAYMSPEQCAGDPAAIDIRADVYSLGVVLYELLCGQTPFDAKDKSILEAALSIREDLPARPSAIVKAVRGDLETIVLCAIHRERDRRYQSVADLAADIRRFLASEPIAARPATTIYHLRMFARRNRALAAGVAIASFGLLIGTGGAIWQAVRATDEAARARDEADTANRVARCLQDAIASIDPRVAADDELSRAKLLNTSAESVARELKDKPLAQATFYERLGDAYLGLSLYDRSAGMYRAASKLQADHDAPLPDRVRVLASWARACRGNGDWREAERLSRAALLAPSEPDFLLPRLTAGSTLVLALSRRNELVEAQRIAETALQDAVNSHGAIELVDYRLALSSILEKRGSIGVARGHLLECISGASSELIRTYARFQLGAFEARQGRMDEANAALASANQAWRALAGPRERDGAYFCVRIATLLKTNSQWVAAEPFLREAIERHIEFYGPRHIALGDLYASLGEVLQYLGRPAEALEAYQHAAAILRTAVGDEHPDVGACMFHQARLAVKLRDEVTLRQLLDEAAVLERVSSRLPANHPHRSGLLLLTGFVEMNLGKPLQAEPKLRECVRLRSEQLGPDNRITLYAHTVLGGCLAIQGRFEEAEAHLGEFVPRVEAAYTPGSFMSAEARQRLVDLYTAWGRPDLAEAARPQGAR